MHEARAGVRPRLHILRIFQIDARLLDQLAAARTNDGNRTDVVHRLQRGDRLILVPDPPGTDVPAVWVHAPGGDVQVPTMRDELTRHGFRNISPWARGVDTVMFHPKRDGERDIFEGQWLRHGAVQVPRRN